MQTFDLVVIGTGVAATSVAFPCRSAGWSVALIDDRPFGGTCATRGCDPKKVLVGVAEVVDSARRLKAHGVAADSIHVNWADLMRFKASFTDAVPENRAREFSKAGISAYRGIAAFVSEDSLDIGHDRLRARHFVIASGSGPARLNIPGEHLLINSDQFLELKELPTDVTFIGGGYIAFEFAHVAARAGAKVIILHRSARPLHQFDADMVERLVACTRNIGIDIRLNTPVDRIERVGDRLSVHAGPLTFETALAVHAAGRVPLLDALNLSAARVEQSPKGVVVNEFLQSVSNPRVYAAGDAAATGAPQLTPAASYDGRIVANNLLKGNHESPDYAGCASTVFAIPPLASVGLTEATARERNLDFDVNLENTSGWYSSRRLADECSGFKVLIERKTNRILGAHLLGAGSEEVINLFALAIRNNLTANQLRDNLFAYPTYGSNMSYMVV